MATFFLLPAQKKEGKEKATPTKPLILIPMQFFSR